MSNFYQLKDCHWDCIKYHLYSLCHFGDLKDEGDLPNIYKYKIQEKYFFPNLIVRFSGKS